MYCRWSVVRRNGEPAERRLDVLPGNEPQRPSGGLQPRSLAADGLHRGELLLQHPHAGHHQAGQRRAAGHLAGAVPARDQHRLHAEDLHGRGGGAPDGGGPAGPGAGLHRLPDLLGLRPGLQLHGRTGTHTCIYS